MVPTNSTQRISARARRCPDIEPRGRQIWAETTFDVFFHRGMNGMCFEAHASLVQAVSVVLRVVEGPRCTGIPKIPAARAQWRRRVNSIMLQSIRRLQARGSSSAIMSRSGIEIWSRNLRPEEPRTSTSIGTSTQRDLLPEEERQKDTAKGKSIQAQQRDSVSISVPMCYM